MDFPVEHAHVQRTRAQAKKIVSDGRRGAIPSSVQHLPVSCCPLLHVRSWMKLWLLWFPEHPAQHAAPQISFSNPWKLFFPLHNCTYYTIWKHDSRAEFSSPLVLCAELAQLRTSLNTGQTEFSKTRKQKDPLAAILRHYTPTAKFTSYLHCMQD